MTGPLAIQLIGRLRATRSSERQRFSLSGRICWSSGPCCVGSRCSGRPSGRRHSGWRWGKHAGLLRRAWLGFWEPQVRSVGNGRNLNQDCNKDCRRNRTDSHCAGLEEFWFNSTKQKPRDWALKSRWVMATTMAITSLVIAVGSLFTIDLFRAGGMKIKFAVSTTHTVHFVLRA